MVALFELHNKSGDPHNDGIATVAGSGNARYPRAATVKMGAIHCLRVSSRGTDFGWIRQEFLLKIKQF